MEKLDKQCCFPTADEMAAQIQELCPHFASEKSCKNCYAFSDNKCPLGYYSAFLTGVRLLNWRLWTCKTQHGL